MSAPDEQLVADVEEVFLGWWPDDVMAIVRQPYTPGGLAAYAHRDNGAYLPVEDA
ncbi:hypothetical protein [Streptomyces sp. NPDC006610]|uniref:hypothetical protein n=1 Tax=Streptomyces sp. NPDC006610 TaxID=3154584 RepID=UPI0033B952D5